MADVRKSDPQWIEIAERAISRLCNAICSLRVLKAEGHAGFDELAARGLEEFEKDAGPLAPRRTGSCGDCPGCPLLASHGEVSSTWLH